MSDKEQGQDNHSVKEQNHSVKELKYNSDDSTIYESILNKIDETLSKSDCIYCEEYNNLSNLYSELSDDINNLNIDDDIKDIIDELIKISINDKKINIFLKTKIAEIKKNSISDKEKYKTISKQIKKLIYSEIVLD